VRVPSSLTGTTWDRSVDVFVLELFFGLDAAWLNVSVVRAVALLSATNG